MTKEIANTDNIHAIDILMHVQNTLNCLRDQIQLGIEGPDEFDRFDYTSIDVANERIKNVLEFLKTGKLEKTIHISAL
jgi:hypothetical protein